MPTAKRPAALGALSKGGVLAGAASMHRATQSAAHAFGSGTNMNAGGPLLLLGKEK